MTNDMIRELKRIVGDDGVLAEKGERAVYENDAYPLEKAAPLATVLPRTTAQVAEVVRVCARHNLPFAPRGAGTGLAGGTLCPGGVLIGVARMNRILDIDLRNRRLTAQAGAVNIALTKAVAADGYLYAPDPSSQGASTLGGNIANNAGGPHTLKYGVTANHVLAVEMVLPDGEVVTLGDKTEDVNGYDLLGLALGSEGTFGIVTEATVRLTRAPQAVRTLLAVFDTVDDATQTVSDIIAGGIVPAALEMMDAVILQTVEDAFHFGFPRDAGAILIIELDGLEAGLEAQADRVRALCGANAAREVRQAHTPKDRANLWAARKKAVGTLGRLAPSCVTQDCVIPRSKLPTVLRAIAAIGVKYDLRIANVFHAGDGNLHPSHPVRRAQPRRGEARFSRLTRDSGALRRCRRDLDGRTRHRRREARPHAPPVPARDPQDDGGGPGRLQSPWLVQPRQSPSHFPRLRLRLPAPHGRGVGLADD